MAIQIGKYKRPGIFIEEHDNSVITTPIVEGITNMVIGVSRKGPINTPIRLNTLNDLEAIFGQLDRGLERKGSYFHRTIQKMLESSPVYAINLLKTDDELDRIEYKSLSSSSGSFNDTNKEGAYRRFFDTSGFWKRDTESFLNLTKPNVGYTERAFSITNLSDRHVTAFIVKSKMNGFDRSLIEWYGSLEKLPAFVNANDWASDYMVDVIIIGGNWTDYKTLAVDPRWGQYFNNTGLLTDKLRSFANDSNVTLLAYYEGLSLIPYFRDSNDRNIFIETVINRDTDKTGLFCAFNEDLVESDFYNGMLDLVGQTLTSDKSEIEFLSYKESIIEKIKIDQKPLDLPGNVTALGGSYTSQSEHAYDFDFTNNTPLVNGDISYENRTFYYSEGSVFRVTGGSSTANISMSQSSGVTYSLLEVEYTADQDAFAIIGGRKVNVDVSNGNIYSFKITLDNTYIGATGSEYMTVFYLNESGEIKYNSSKLRNTFPSVSNSDIVLGFSIVTKDNVGEFSLKNFDDVTVDNNGYVDMDSSAYEILDYTQDYAKFGISNLNPDEIKVYFGDTSTNSKNYYGYRRMKMFNHLLNILNGPNKDRACIIDTNNQFDKFTLEGSEVKSINNNATAASPTPAYASSYFSIVYGSEQDSYFTLKLNFNDAPTVVTNIVNDQILLIYKTDDELIFGKKGVKTIVSMADQSGVGVAGKYSSLYQNYFDGVINTGDNFNTNRLFDDGSGSRNNVTDNNILDVIFMKADDESNITDPGFRGYSYIIFESDFDLPSELGLTYNDIIKIDSKLNRDTITLTNSYDIEVPTYSDPEDLALQLGYTASSIPGGKYYAYFTVENVTDEVVTNVKNIYDYTEGPIYLKMYLENETDLVVDFTSDDLSSPTDFDNVVGNRYIYVNSAISNYKQTLEIETPEVDYVREPNKIVVNSTRYTEVKAGDYLDAFYDLSELEVGETPRRLTRILSKRAYKRIDGTIDSTYSELTCDSEIKIEDYSGDLQTNRYLPVTEYAKTYKGLSLKGFRIRQASLPNGTEERQNQILNMVAKGTSLFKALTNKESIDFRYLIDSFGLGLTERSKQQLVDICGDRLDVFGFINMPSMKDFKNSSSPSFVNDEGVLQLEYVSKGGDPESSPAFLYSFGDGSGASSVGYFMPYVTVSDNGRPASVPPAAWVATTYMRKHNSIVTGITPWTIAAGVTNGRVTNIAGIEMDFTLEDIEWINQGQMNPVVFKRNRGNIIETENTAQTLYKSALSYIHVREVLIELERELSRMLLDYQWKFNTPDVRAEIKLRADVICETYVSKNGLYNYFNKMDEENNTPEIIDHQMGIVSTFIEPIKGMGIIVNDITILRTGAINSGGFMNQ
jgi:hypothetical protein